MKETVYSCNIDCTTGRDGECTDPKHNGKTLMFSEEITNRLSDEMKELINRPTTPRNRSKALMRLAYDGAESGLTNNEIAIVIENRGIVWGKFDNKDMYNKSKSIVKIVKFARDKYNTVNGAGRYVKDN